LRRFLVDEGFGTAVYVCGERGASPHNRSHAWLEVDGLIVDITADQFPEQKAEPVIVTIQSAWHDEFRLGEEEQEELGGKDPCDVRAYHAILKNID
jgi:hypothetical protein